MNHQTIVFFSAVVIFPWLFINIKRTREILLWESRISIQVIYAIAVWLLPFLGAFIIFRKLNLHYINRKLEQTADSDTIAGDAFLGIDAIFNPGQANVKQAKEEVVVEKRGIEGADGLISKTK
jgi:flagellar biosynthesis/type III secretory pathway M-ring protein FliF/YscJ